MRVLHKMFRSTFKTWDALFAEASDFATSLGPDHLISISHSANNADGIVVVWFWGEPDFCRSCGYDLTGNVSGVCPECGRKL